MSLITIEDAPSTEPITVVHEPLGSEAKKEPTDYLASLQYYLAKAQDPSLSDLEKTAVFDNLAAAQRLYAEQMSHGIPVDATKKLGSGAVSATGSQESHE